MPLPSPFPVIEKCERGVTPQVNGYPVFMWNLMSEIVSRNRTHISP